MSRVEVTTKENLKRAQEQGVYEIIVIGELAEKLKKSKKIVTVGVVGIAVLVAAFGVATVTAPVSGGLSYFAVAPVAALTGVEIAVIITAASVGITLVIAVFKDYEEISFSSGEMTLRKRSQ